MLQQLTLCVLGSGAGMSARVVMAQGGQHVGDMPTLQNQHAQLTLQPIDLVMLSDGGVSRHLSFELAGLLFQLRYVRMKLSAEVLSLTCSGGNPTIVHAANGNPPSANSAVFQPDWREICDAEFAGTAPRDRFGE